MAQPTNRELEKMMSGEHVDDEPLRAIEEGVVTISREEFNVLNGVSASDELWKNFLTERGIQPNKLYEFHITEADGTETIGAYGTDETREIDGVVEERDEHLTKHPAETAELLEKYKNQPEQLDEIERAEVVDAMGDEAVEEVVEAPTEAQGLRDRLRAAVVDRVEGEKTPESSEKLISDVDASIAGSIINQLAIMEEGFNNGGVNSADEAKYHRDRFIGTMNAEINNKLHHGTIGKEAYVFINSALLGASQDGEMMSDILRGLVASKVLSERDIDIIHGQMVNIEHASRMEGKARQRYLRQMSFDLDQIAADVYQRNENKASEAYIAVQGLAVGVAAQMSSWLGSTRISSAISHLSSLKR